MRHIVAADYIPLHYPLKQEASTLASLCATPDQCQGMCLGEMLTTAVIRTLGLIFVAADYIPLQVNRGY